VYFGSNPLRVVYEPEVTLTVVLRDLASPLATIGACVALCWGLGAMLWASVFVVIAVGGGGLHFQAIVFTAISVGFTWLSVWLYRRWGRSTVVLNLDDGTATPSGRPKVSAPLPVMRVEYVKFYWLDTLAVTCLGQKDHIQYQVMVRSEVINALVEPSGKWPGIDKTSLP